MQLKNLLENYPKIWTTISRLKNISLSSDYRGEIPTGKLYNSRQVRQFLNQGDNFTMAWNTDGVRVQKSNNFDIWPLLCSINELDVLLKGKNIIMIALWFGSTKPTPETFLMPFIKEAQALLDEGFEWKDPQSKEMRRSRILFLIGIADAPARAMLTKIKQYNGEFGCGFCKHPGVQTRIIRKDGTLGGKHRVYPTEIPFPEKRTHTNTLEEAKRAVSYFLLGGPDQYWTD